MSGPCRGHEARFPWSNGELLPSAPLSPTNPPSPSQHERTLRLYTFALMSHPSLAAVSSSGFQLVVNDALRVYKKRTKKDLISLPLASELQGCNSSAAILDILQRQVQGLEPSRSSDDRRTKWLVPTVKVLYTFSATLEERAGLVSLRTYTCLIFAFLYVWQEPSHGKLTFSGIGVLLVVRTLLISQFG